MTMDKNIYINDLMHRYASHTFTETTVGSMTNVAFKDSGSDTVGEATKLLAIDAYHSIRLDLLGGETPAFVMTTTEQAALSSVDQATPAYNITTGRSETYTGSAWIGAAGAGAMADSAFGEMVEDNSSGSTIHATSHLWNTASAGEVDANGLITISSLTDKSVLVVNTGGAGTYRVSFECRYTNAGGNDTTASIYQNATQISDLQDTGPGDSGEKRKLSDGGFLVLADDDQIVLEVVSATLTDVITLYHCHVTMTRMT
ncbi:MAG: hypothetical protein V3W44_10135 [Dehalococcoidales bacterium]